MSNSNFDYYFQAQTTDNNGQTCTDINIGLKNLFEPFCEEKPTMTSSQRILVSEVEEGYPDLVAYKSILNNQDLWWWVLLACRLDDAFEGIKSNYIYPIFELLIFSDIKTNSTYEVEENQSVEVENTPGTAVELN